MNDVGLLIFGGIVFWFIIAIPVIVHNKRKSPEQKKAEQERLARRRAELAEHRDRERLAREIVEVKLLDGGDMHFKRGGLGGAMFGGFIGGAPGAVIGAVLPSGKGTQSQKFAVKYGDGHVEIVEHDPGTETYKKLMQYVKWEEVQ